ncbi:MAG: PQQ-binding-like beta-propeller repeat protein, partial [Phycisphaerales bacterium]|nr:PQQ-binding-like beta-propeller repeat protein [Phycisphaerales bacterium]
LGAGDKKGAEALEAKRHAALTEAVKLARSIAETYPDKRVPDIRIGAIADNNVRDTAETPLMAAGYWAQGRFIPKLIREHGRKCYASFDDQAGDMLQKAIIDNDSEAMLNVAKNWPNSLWANQAMYEGGTSLYVKARDDGGSDDYAAMSQAAAWMARAADTDDSMLKTAALAGRATIYHGLGMTNYSRSICRDIRQLCRTKGITLSDTIEFAGGEKHIIDFLKKCEGGKPLPFEQAASKISLKAPLDKAFALTGEELFAVRDQEYRPVRQGANLLLIEAGRAVWCNTAAKSAEDAILWKSGAPVVQMDLIRNYMTAPGYGLVAGISGNGKIVAIADRGSRSATGFDIATGKVAWRGAFAEWGIKGVSYLSSGDGVMVITDNTGLVVCVDMNTGKIRWIGSRITGANKAPVGPPRIERGVVMVTTNNYKKLTCYHAKGGKALGTWSASSSVYGRVTEGGMILVMVDGVVSIHDPARMDRPLWAKKYSSSSQPMVLTSDTGKLFISQGKTSPWIDVISMSDGRQLARLRCGNFTGSTTPVVTGAVVRSGSLYVTFGAKLSGMRNRYFGRQTLVGGMGVQKIDIADGTVLWKNELGPLNYYYYSLPLIVSDNALAVACKDTQQTKPRHVYLLDSETGRSVQNIELYKGVTGVMKQGDRVRLGAVLQPLLLGKQLVVETFEGVSVYKQK